MNADTIDLLKQLAARFNVTVDYLWPLLVLYTRWTNVAWLAINTSLLVASVIVAVFSLKMVFRHAYLYNHRDNKDYSDYNYHALAIVVSVAGVIIPGIIGLAAISSIPGNVAGVAVPEAKAIYDLLAQITAKK